jgi:hypothetical protein
MVTKESDFYAKNTFLHTKNETQDFLTTGCLGSAKQKRLKTFLLPFSQCCNGRNVVVTKFHNSVRCWEADQAQKFCCNAFKFEIRELPVISKCHIRIRTITVD